LVYIVIIIKYNKKIQTSNCLFFNGYIFWVNLMKVEWVIIAIKCVYFTWNIFCENNFHQKKKWKLLLTYLSRKLENQQELVILLVQAVNNNFFWSKFSLDQQQKQKKLTWILKSQDLNSNSLMERHNVCGSLRINWIIHPNLTLTCIT